MVIEAHYTNPGGHATGNLRYAVGSPGVPTSIQPTTISTGGLNRSLPMPSADVVSEWYRLQFDPIMREQDRARREARGPANQRVPHADHAEFWCGQELPWQNRARDVLQVEFVSYRIINHISFEVSRFPHTVEAEYWDVVTEEWLPFKEWNPTPAPLDPKRSIAAQRSRWEGPDLEHTILDSFPPVVNTASVRVAGTRKGATKIHPQHQGEKHWVHVMWRPAPVYTRAIRLILTRPGPLVHCSPPHTAQGLPAPYSLAVRHLQCGYKVHAENDVPEGYFEDDFASSSDLLGRQISYRLKKYHAKYALDGVDGLHWRSEPQPVNYAVVNYYLDMRDSKGRAQTFDRLYLDPLTVGPTMNVYWTNDEPDSAFAASDDPLRYPVGRSLGEEPLIERRADGKGEVLDFSPVKPGNLQFDNGHLQWNHERPWWAGVALRMETDTGTHPLLSFSGNTLRQNGRVIEFATAQGTVVSCNVPESVQVGSDLNISLVYRPADGMNTPTPDEGGFWLAESTLTLTVGNADGKHHRSTQVPSRPLGQRPETIYVGTDSTDGTVVSDMALRGLFLTTDMLPESGYVDGFVAEPDLFILKSAAHGQQLTNNAILRIHPSFYSDELPTAAVGGAGDRYEDVTWTPVPRDYALAKGVVHLPVIKAKHVKLEFTNLVLMNFETSVPIKRRVRLFPEVIVKAQEPEYKPPSQRAVRYYNYTPPDFGKYAPQLQGLDLGIPPGGILSSYMKVEKIKGSGAEVYVSKDPSAQALLADTSWLWAFSPWHLGVTAPRWDITAPHDYETVEIEHQSKTAFFVGLKQVMAYRQDYLTDDDAEVYHEPFDNDDHLDELVGVVQTDGGYSAISHAAQITSKVFPSQRQVRALQFASIQTENKALLPDDGFVHEDLSANWQAYGDATIERVIGQGVVLTRGVMAESGGGGGISSGIVYPSKSGRIYAAARVTPQSTSVAGAVRLEIIAINTGTVLAATEERLAPGVRTVLKVGHEVGSAFHNTTYGDLEDMSYGDMQVGRSESVGTFAQGTYGDLENSPVGGPVYVRLRQVGPSTDVLLVERLSLFDAPVTWEFSVDGGETWFDAMSVRNNPRAVLSFPESGTQLRWRVSIFHSDAAVSDLVIRPWYSGLAGSVGRDVLDYVGPNRSVIDDYPDIEADPMWSQSFDPIPSWWYRRDSANQFGYAPNMVSRGEVIGPPANMG